LRSVEALSEFQSPQEPGIEKRLILVFVLTFVVILISQKLIFKNAPQKPEEQKQTQSQQAPTQPTGTPQAAAAVPPPAPAAVGTKQASAEQEIVVENGLYKITFTNKGAQVKSWILKKYKDERGNPLELVHLQAASQYGY